MMKKSMMGSVLLASLILLGQSPRDWRASHEGEILAEYRELLAIPNIARNLPDMRRNAEVLQRMFAKRGVPLQLLEVPDAPAALFGELRVPGATRTLVFYAHYDGQPVTPSQWLNGNPFQPELRDASGKLIPWESVTRFDPEWRIHARSAADDKAPIMAFLVALDALRAAGKTPTVNLKFFLDGEEELLSPHLSAVVDKYKPLLSSDGWVIFDGPTHPSRRQLISFGARGNFNLELTVYGPNEELHSGHYGNWAPNPRSPLLTCWLQ
jgi:acetylornithine deacetylase/succinyl-diaminopimelate desuccinylase-like protein